jgi:hypothetical protein
MHLNVLIYVYSAKTLLSSQFVGIQIFKIKCQTMNTIFNKKMVYSQKSKVLKTLT